MNYISGILNMNYISGILIFSVIIHAAAPLSDIFSHKKDFHSGIGELPSLSQAKI